MIQVIAVLAHLFLDLTCSQTPPGFAPNISEPLLIEFNRTVDYPSGELLPEAGEWPPAINAEYDLQLTISMTVVASPPTLGTNVSLTGTYLAAMVDPGAGTTTEVIEVLHYLLPGLSSSKVPTISNSTAFYPLVTSNSSLAPYLSPEPTPGKAHTYVIVLYEQPAALTIPRDYTSFLPLHPGNLTNRYPFNLTALTRAAGLGKPVRGGYFDVQHTGAGSDESASGTTTTMSGTSTKTTSSTAAEKTVKTSGQVHSRRLKGTIRSRSATSILLGMAAWMRT
ncbi:hypothetical protein ACLMJK_003862 [Lecanora helva]